MAISAVQSCCDQHYNCWKTDFIAPGEQKHGITNTMAGIAAPCECNSRFVKCLKGIHTLLGIVLHSTYTTGVNKCFLYSWPIKDCLSRDSYNRCTRYAIKDGDEKHQLFDQHYNVGDDDDGIITSDDLQIRQRSMEYDPHHVHQFDQQLIPYPVTFLPHNGFLQNLPKNFQL